MENKYPLFKLEFTDDKLPKFIEVNSRDYVTNGEENNYPNHLIDLLNRSGKHNAIVTGVATMIVGGGFKSDGVMTPDLLRFMENPNDFESLNDILAKCALDLKLFGGFYLENVWSRDGLKIASMYHVPFQEVRVNKTDTAFLRSDKWSLGMNTGSLKPFNKFNPSNHVGGEAQIFFYKEYRPGLKHYPLPDYIGGIQHIYTDTEIANYHYNNIKNAFSNGTIITFTNGVPTQDEQRLIQRKLELNKAGTDNAGGITVNFVDKADQAPIISRMQPDENDKQYLQLETATADNIFISHRITNPSIFGVKVAGQLGSRQDLIDSKEVFYVDYIKIKVAEIERTFNYLLKWISQGSKLIIEKGNSTDNSGDTKVADTTTAIPVKQSAQLNESDILLLFDECGEPASNYRIIKQKRLRFNSDIEEEDKFKDEWFADFEFAEALNIDISVIQSKVLSVIKENPQLTTADIATIANISPQEANDALQYLSDEGVINIDSKAGQIKITDRGLKTIDEGNIISTEIFVKYKYDGPEDSKNRPFCHQVLQKNKLFTKDDIDMVSQKAGYNVWTQRGGWYHNPDGVNTPYCRHWWSQVLVKKKVR